MKPMLLASPLLSEITNGVWVILALALTTLSGFYLHHELRARRVTWPPRRTMFTSGMRVAIALATLSLGVAISHFPIWQWRHFERALPLGEVSIAMIAVGSFVGAAGFLCAIREISKPLYGNVPWLTTLLVVVVFSAVTVLVY